ncbi:MAG TPA: glycosyltransferase family 2 protein [Gemmatimonadales bacterium]|nr:glycosyltransferase family 2 protein [Gemmatimonadales bacterium]
MLYVCIPSYNEAPTIGLLLWKIRQTFTAFPREYQLLVADDASTDATSELLEPYARVLPLTVLRHAERQGYAASIEALLRLSLERSDRPKRDAAIVMQADFSHGPAFLPDLVRRLDSGADMVVAEASLTGEASRARRLLRRFGPWLLRSSVRAPGVSDVLSGFVALRLVTLRNAVRDYDRLLTIDGCAANAELIGKTARFARRVDTVPVVERHDLRQRASRVDPFAAALALWRARSKLRIPHRPPATVPTPERRTERPAGVAS